MSFTLPTVCVRRIAKHGEIANYMSYRQGSYLNHEMGLKTPHLPLS